MVPHPIEQEAQVKSLGAFERSYRESCSLSRAWGYTLLGNIFILVWGVALFSVPFNQLTGFWPLTIFSIIWFSICFSLIASPWRSYLNPEWIYLYNHGFIYHKAPNIQTYHWNDIASLDLRYSFSLNGKNPSVFRSYQVNLKNEATLNLVKGSDLKLHFERYQQELPPTTPSTERKEELFIDKAQSD
jgi:hypothetical protein